jgi:hypothetical protein
LGGVRGGWASEEHREESGMTDRPIIFSAPMVQALLAGRKTQTRRLLRLPRWATSLDEVGDDGYTLWCVSRDSGCRSPALPQFLPTDRLWVREAWAAVDTDGERWIDYRSTPRYPEASKNRAAAWDHDPDSPEAIRWRPSIHMPRWASRITLTVIDVRVQELLDISEEDAAAEGCSEGRFNDGFGPTPIGNGLTIESPGGFYSAAGAFQMLWQKIHPDWDGFSSPWVVALTFAVEQRNIDA